jgi:hypothetical protein
MSEALEVELKERTRYGNLYTLSCLLCCEDFWFNGDLREACQAKDFESLQRHLTKAYPPVREFISVIDWQNLASSAIAIRNFGADEHNRLLGRLGLLRGES